MKNYFVFVLIDVILTTIVKAYSKRKKSNFYKVSINDLGGLFLKIAYGRVNSSW